MADIAVDLGTANTLIQVKGRGVVLNEPSVVAVERGTGQVITVGLEAKRMLGRTPHAVMAVRPMRGGVIADVDRVDLMLRHFLRQALPRRRFRFRPRVLLAVPSGITEMERRAVRAGINAAGAGAVHLISEPMAAAIGAGLPVNSPKGSMVVNIGGGTTEIGVIALSGLVSGTSVRIGGNELDEIIIQLVRRAHNLLIGEGMAEAIKLQIGSAVPLQEEQQMEVRGRDLVSGIPKTIMLTSEEVRESLREAIQTILAAVRQTLEVTPPELASDILDEGIVLTGGGALLRGLDRVISEDARVAVRTCEDPLTTVVRGAGEVLDDWSRYHDVLM